MLVSPVVTDEAAGAAELLTVVLLLVVSAFEIGESRNNPSNTAEKYLKFLRVRPLTRLVFLSL